MFAKNSKELAQHKLVLLYIIYSSDFNITNTEITQFVLESNYMNYFLVQQYLSELISSKFITLLEENKIQYYKLTELGDKTLQYFKNNIPQTIKDDIKIKIEKNNLQKIKEKQITSDYFKKNDSEYIVNLKVKENDIIIFNISLNVVSSKQAKHICKNWKKNPDFIYKNIINLLISDYKNNDKDITI
ncbi:DUF4364 family protein [Abyssisolibacter fermentans]|uniref:DUF4364 family protein n=1 Tax=Abyssisolibacter fermentans TaxID=1766203 RepID=UPI000832361E|nr:DUF4364 family protein [Abyssisolibacter fermentans]